MQSIYRKVSTLWHIAVSHAFKHTAPSSNQSATQSIYSVHAPTTRLSSTTAPFPTTAPPSSTTP